MQLGYSNLLGYLVLAFGIVLVQYMLGPKMVEWTMRVSYIKRGDNPKLFAMVESLSAAARIPMPRVCISSLPIPNAFAFGRSLRDGRVCVTAKMLELVDDEELRAVLGHEISHLKNRDVMTMTLLSVVPMVLYWVYLQFSWYGRRRNERDSSNLALVGIAALVLYWVTSLLLMYGSRVREYFADKGAIDLGNKPASMASALYKLVYGSARADEATLQQVQGLKTFFVSDPGKAAMEIRELKQLDGRAKGYLAAEDLMLLKGKKVNIGAGQGLLELFSSHPNMLKRIRQLAQYQ
jgi:heat shock protein HtpX